jgi:hypothetical protein
MINLRKILLTLIVLTLSLGGFAQSVSSPSASSYSQSTSNQSASGFSLSNFNSSATLLVTIGLVNPPAGVTLTLASSSGLTRSTGYNSWSNFTRISFTGTQSNINTALSNLNVNTGSTPGNVYIAVTATENPTGYFYLPTNGHFYQPVSGSRTYTSAKSAAASQTFKGQTGYLVTITSQDEQNFIHANVPVSNIWFALSDAGLEGQWRIDAGPENGTLVWTASASVNNSTTGSYSSAGTTASGQFTAWAGGEPNNSDGSIGEDHAVTKWGGANTWNDLRDGNSSGIGGYVVEFGTWTDPANQTFTDFYTGFVTHQIACSPAQTPNAPTAVNGSRNGAGIVTLSATVGTGQTVDWYANSTGGNPFLSNNTSYTTPSISTTTSYYAQARNTTTGCVSSSRTAVTATIIMPTPFNYSGYIRDWDSLPIGGVGVKLYTKLKTGSTYSLHQTYSTDSNGQFIINTSLDTSTYDFQVTIGDVTTQTPSTSDAEFFNQKILNDSIEAKDYYRMNTNGNAYLTISDIYLIYQRIYGANWPAGVPAYRLFSQSEKTIIDNSTSNLLNTYPGQQTVTLPNLVTNSSSTYYLITTGAEK